MKTFFFSWKEFIFVKTIFRPSWYKNNVYCKNYTDSSWDAVNLSYKLCERRGRSMGGGGRVLEVWWDRDMVEVGDIVEWDWGHKWKMGRGGDMREMDER